MEIVISILAVIIGILLWLFPPEPLRKLFRIDKQERKLKEYPIELCTQFQKFINSLEPVDSDNFRKKTTEAEVKKNDPSLHIDMDAKRKLTRWISSLDDELLLLARKMIQERKTGAKLGVTQIWISNNSHPLGEGRSVEELIEALSKVGLLSPTTEPEEYNANYIASNPSWDYGNNLYEAQYYILLAESKGVFDGEAGSV